MTAVLTLTARPNSYVMATHPGSTMSLRFSVTHLFLFVSGVALALGLVSLGALGIVAGTIAVPLYWTAIISFSEARNESHKTIKALTLLTSFIFLLLAFMVIAGFRSLQIGP